MDKIIEDQEEFDKEHQFMQVWLVGRYFEFNQPRSVLHTNALRCDFFAFW